MSKPRFRLQFPLRLAAGLIPVAPIVIGMLIGGQGARAEPLAAQPYTPVTPLRTLPSVPASSWIPAGPGALVAVVMRDTTMRSSPAGRPIGRLTARTDFGSPAALWVVAHTGEWLGVVSPIAGNGRVGWIPASVTSLGRVTWEVKVSLGARQLTVLDAGRVVQRYTVAIGRPSAPTPTGRFEVTDRLATNDPGGPYGCCILATSAHSPHAIQGWGGGNRIAIHSTPESWSIGQPVGHGCLRLTLAEGQWLLDHIPLGTPVLISS